MSPPRVSIVIPTKDGAGTLPAVLHAIWQQRFAGGIEVIAVDSGSTDGTLDILRDRVDRLITVPPERSSRGLTLNLGAEAATGGLVVLLAQDAVPQSDHWLTALTAPAYADPHVAGTFGRQLPRDDASNLARFHQGRRIAATDTPFTSALRDQAEWEQMSPAERHRRCAFDTVSSCIRRSAWQAHRFREADVAEDVEWARDVLLAGHRIAFVPDAVVVHSRERPVREEFRRTREAHERLIALFQLETIASVPQLARGVALSLAVHVWCELAMPERLPRAVALAIAWPLAQYLGARRGVAGAPAPAGLGISG